ncbi:hypothetical protein ACF1BQ_043610 [Bradyrhizobium sp. RDT10]
MVTASRRTFWVPSSYRIVRRAQRDLDVRPHLGELLDDALVGAFEQFGIGILNDDFGLRLRQTGDKRKAAAAIHVLNIVVS